MNEALAIELSRLEAELHLPAVRADGDRVSDLLHAEFEEVGRSGQFHSRNATLIALKREAHPYEIASDGYVATKIGTDVALLTYRSAHRQEDGTFTRHTLRSSIWVLVTGHWKLRYHQGTPTTDVW